MIAVFQIYIGATSRVFKSSWHDIIFFLLTYRSHCIFILEYRVAHVSLQTVFETSSDFRKMKSRARFSLYRVSGLDFVKTFKPWSPDFQTRVLASRQVSDFTICHPLPCEPTAV